MIEERNLNWAQLNHKKREKKNERKEKVWILNGALHW